MNVHASYLHKRASRDRLYVDEPQSLWIQDFRHDVAKRHPYVYLYFFRVHNEKVGIVRQ